MANFFQDLIKKVMPDELEYKLGITPQPKAMTFRVGQGLTPEQQTIAQQKLEEFEQPVLREAKLVVESGGTKNKFGEFTNVSFREVPSSEIRNGQIDDYFIKKDGGIEILVSKNLNSVEKQKTKIHALVESNYLKKNNVSFEKVNRFDAQHKNSPEPGNRKDAPYFIEHQLADRAEKLFNKNKLPETMTFRVGEISKSVPVYRPEEKKAIAEKKVETLAREAPAPQENFFARLTQLKEKTLPDIAESIRTRSWQPESLRKVTEFISPTPKSEEEAISWGLVNIGTKEKPFYYDPLGAAGGMKRVGPKFAKIVGAERVAMETKALAKKAIETTAGVKAVKISEKAVEKVGEIINSVKPELEGIRGKTLTHKEVEEAAKKTEVLKIITSRNETLKREAQILRTKQNLAALAEGKTLTKEFIDNLRIVSSEASNLGRQLESLKIEALPELATTKTEIVKKLTDLGIETDKILEASKGIDFTNAAQVTKFYRTFVKPSFRELIDEYRYINLLSSPKTHIVNAFSNLLQTTVLAPATKLVSGGLDLIGSGITKKQRQFYISEVPAYYKGLFNSVGDATSQVLKVLKGQQQIYRPDIARMPTGSKVLTPFQLIPKMMEASDIFFRTLITGAEKEALALRKTKQGVKLGLKELADLEDEAKNTAEYFVFRAPLGKKEQGHLLQTIDKVTSGVYRLRNIPGVNWFIPFVATPMNILKQGIEYSPLGFSTIPGVTQKTEQLAKALVGSTIFLGAGYLSQKGDSTWAVPKDTKEKAYFYASGKQPYSLKIGDNWINYSRLGPLSYPIALSAAVKYYFEQNPQAVTQDNLEKTAKTISGVAQFFSDQSYVQGMGDLIDTLSGDEQAIGRTFANMPSQLIPLESLVRWINNYFIDPVYRETKKGLSVESIIQNIEKSLPILSQQLPPYKEPFGEPSKRQMPITNALSPLGITTERQEYQDLYDLLMQKRTMSAELKKMKEELRKELGL